MHLTTLLFRAGFLLKWPVRCSRQRTSYCIGGSWEREESAECIRMEPWRKVLSPQVSMQSGNCRQKQIERDSAKFGSSPQWGQGKVSTWLHLLNDSPIGPMMRRENATWGPPKALDGLWKLSWETSKNATDNSFQIKVTLLETRWAPAPNISHSVCVQKKTHWPKAQITRFLNLKNIHFNLWVQQVEVFLLCLSWLTTLNMQNLHKISNHEF